MLNPALKVKDLGSLYQDDQRIRIDDFLESKFSQAVIEAVTRNLQFDSIFFSKDKNLVVSDAQMASLDAQQLEGLQQELMQLASRGVGFFYSGYRLEGENLRNAPHVLKQLFEIMNSDNMLKMISSITGIKGLKRASGQFTRYASGSYLTRHLDDIKAERRVLAYVLNLTLEWHPDWGGLLMFYEQNGTPRDAWEPRFNSLSLFDVRHIHAVTYVTPFAGRARYALTGWFSN